MILLLVTPWSKIIQALFQKRNDQIPLCQCVDEIFKLPVFIREILKEGLKTILKCIDLVKNGTSVFIFPEGTRTSG